MEGLERPLLTLGSHIRTLRTNLLNFVFGERRGPSDRSLITCGDGSDGAVALNSEPPWKTCDTTAPGRPFHPGSFELRGDVAVPQAAVPAATTTETATTETANSGNSIRPDEREVRLSLDLHGFPGVAGLAEAVRRVCATVFALPSPRGGHLASAAQDLDEAHNEAHDAARRAVAEALPALGAGGPFDLDGVCLSGGPWGAEVDPAAAEVDPAAAAVRLLLPFHHRRCATRYPRLWGLVAKIARLELRLREDPEAPAVSASGDGGGRTDGGNANGGGACGAARPALAVIVSPRGLDVRGLCHGRDGVWGRAEDAEMPLPHTWDLDGAPWSAPRSGGLGGRRLVWAPFAAAPGRAGALGEEARAMGGAAAAAAAAGLEAIPFSLEPGFELRLAVEARLSVRAVLGLATLPLPALHLRLAWCSGGAGGNSGAEGRGGAAFRGAGTLDAALVSVGPLALPGAEWAIGLLVDLKRLRALLVETLRMSWAFEPTSGRGGGGGGLRGAAARSASSLGGGMLAEQNPPPPSRTKWVLRFKLRARLAPHVTPFFAGILRSFIGHTIGDQVKFECVADVSWPTVQHTPCFAWNEFIV